MPGSDFVQSQHAFPRDYRAGPDVLDWDPSKWIIAFLHRYTGLVTSIRKTGEEDIALAKEYMDTLGRRPMVTNTPSEAKCDDDLDDHEVASEQQCQPTSDRLKNVELPTWSLEQILSYVHGGSDHKRARAVIILDGLVVDITGYVPDHVRA